MFDAQGETRWEESGGCFSMGGPGEEVEEDEEEGEDPDLYVTEATWAEALVILRAALDDPHLEARAIKLQKRLIEDLNEFAVELDLPEIFED